MLQDQPVQLDLLALLVQPELQVQQVLQDRVDQQDQQALLVPQVLQDLQELHQT